MATCLDSSSSSLINNIVIKLVLPEEKQNLHCVEAKACCDNLKTQQVCNTLRCYIYFHIRIIVQITI